MSDRIVHMRCAAKVNLSLSVGPPRSDDGYHPIASWMVAVSLFDDLSVERTDGRSTFDIAWSSDAPRATPIDWAVEKDLTYKAHKLMEAEFGRELPVRVTLRKRIPTGAGLGGGSGDAGGTILAMMRLFQLPMPALDRVVALGSDVPFFLGAPSAIVSGLGERAEPAPLNAPIHMTLILPELRCDTRDVYQAFDKLTPQARLRPIRPENRAEGVLINDLMEPAFDVEPRLRELRDLCAKATGKSVHMTGSGAALFILQPDQTAAIQCAARIKSICGVVATPVHTIDATSAGS